MRFGAHLPLIGFADESFSLASLQDYTRTARDAGFSTLAANDHLVFSRPWLDGPTALAAVLADSGDMALITTVALPVVRGPVAFAKTLAALDLLSGGRVIAGVGPGSSARDYAAVGLDFEERWQRLDEAIKVQRALLDEGAPAFEGRFYSTSGLSLQPRPAQARVPIWVGSWGSDAGLRRVARLADGWLASAYNTTPELFAAARERLEAALNAAGRNGAGFPNALATGFMYLTDDASEADRVVEELIAPAINRPAADLRERLFVGSPAEVADKLARFEAVGLQSAYVWPVRDHVRQLTIFAEKVMPILTSRIPQ